MALMIPSTVQMVSVATPMGVGQNQVTQLVAPSTNVYGLHLISVYTQIIQAAAGGAVAQSLIVAAAKAPVDFTSQLNTMALYRTYQDGSQTAVALGGNSPSDLIDVVIPPYWGLWQVLSVTGGALTRSNVRLSFALGSKDANPL